MELRITNHGLQRMSQRGVRASTVQTVIQFGDRRVPVGDGCISVSVSRNAACELAKEGEISPQTADRLANVCVLVANDNEAVVTVVRPNNNRASRSYMKSRSSKAQSRRSRHQC